MGIIRADISEEMQVIARPRLALTDGARISTRQDLAPRSVDPYTDGAKVQKADPYTDGAKSQADPYTDGAKSKKSAD